MNTAGSAVLTVRKCGSLWKIGEQQKVESYENEISLDYE